MELWIRSQDKETLCKVDDIHIEEQSLYTDTHLIICLGTYKTKERALEILDEIQNILNLSLGVNNNNQLVGTTTFVYKMPED